MSLRNHIEAMPHERLVKELHAHAKRNAQLEDEASRLRHRLFWMSVPPAWKVGEFWSSADPHKKVLCLTEKMGEAAEWEKRKDFIRWVYPT